MNTYASANPFEAIGEAKIFESGTYIEEGEYDLEVKNCIYKKTQASGWGFIVEFEVLAVRKGDSHEVGDTVTWFQKMADESVAMSAIKEFAVAALGVSAKDKAAVDKISANLKDIMWAACNDQQVGKAPARCLNGRKVHDVAILAVGKKSGREYTKHHWTPFVAE